MSDGEDENLSIRDQALLGAAAFFGITAEALIGMLLPLWALERGFGAQAIGVLVALGSFSPLLFAPLAGVLCDRYGDRRMMLLTGALSAFSALCYGSAAGLGVACGVQLLGGLARSTAWVAAQSYAVRRVADVQRPKIMGRFSFSGSVGMLLAPLLAGWLITHQGISAGFLLMAAWSLGLTAVAWALPEVPRERLSTGPWHAAALGVMTMPRLLRRPALSVIMAFTLLRLAAAGVNASFYAVHLAAVGLSGGAIGGLFAVMNAAVAVGALAAARFARRAGPGNLLLGSVALATVSISAVPFTAYAPALAVLSALHGLGLGLSLPTLLAAIGARTVPAERGAVIGLRTVFNRLGYLATPLLLGMLAARMSLAMAFAVNGGLLLGCLALLAWMMRRLGGVDLR